ncbi:MAG: response regulator [Terriglobia bacterium]
MTLNIMVVDDEPAVLRVLRDLLESAGFEVSPFADSREAAIRVEKDKFDAIFVDMRMPGLDGVELTRHIRASQSNSKVPIVMLTGADDADTMRRGFQEGVSFFLGKPVTPKKLMGLINALRAAALRERRRYARLPLRTGVNCQSGQKKFKSASLNISQGGMLLETSGGLTTSAGVQLEFTLPPTASALYPQARVLRKDPPDRMAVEFTVLTSEDSAGLEKYITTIVRG